MSLFKRDPFGNFNYVKRLLITIIGVFSYRRFRGINRLTITGSEIINDLPKKNILFISNHQTYFSDVTAMIHVFNASLNGRVNSIKNPLYLFNQKRNIYFLAAKETMSSGIIPKILEYTGSVSISRTWRSNGKDIKRLVDNKDLSKIQKALNDGWLITFPQGTTKPFAPIRKGTAYLIKEHKPIVVPITIDGFRRSFDKTGLKIKKKGVSQKINIKKPLKIDYDNDSIDEIVEMISYAIEQHSPFK
jgi:1-acyl-sn-glycerol-3-phosphate acyltransferase